MTIKPINYNLTFEPDLEKFTFWGSEILTFEIKEKTNQIVLDAADLKIVNCELLIVNRNIVSSYKADNKNEKLYINFSQELKPGVYKLFLEFNGILNDKLAGFYRSKYTTPEVNVTNKNTSGVKKPKEKYLATTQFEAADARRTFLCIDNPSFKATFNIALIIDKNLTAISNSLPEKTSNMDRSTRLLPTDSVGGRAWQGAKRGKKMVIFEQTPLMSTYLLYMGVGEFEFLEDRYRNIVIRVATTPRKSQHGKFALDCAKKTLEYFEKYFDFPYPLKKLDLIAVSDFASGAMENWGAITFRENALLYYPGKSSKATKQRIAEIVAHEIAHQWFGNLVTMQWWDDLWLNESFATCMAYKAVDHFWPQWRVWDQYLTDTVFEGMALDSLKSSHPIKVKVKKLAEIDELFDEIAYEKGGSMLRMLNLYLGEEAFCEGLRNYIKKYKFKNTQASDLWKSLGRISEKPVLKIMQKYVTQVGFPVVKIDYENEIIRLEQSRFLFESTNLTAKGTWVIPYHLGSRQYRDGIQLLDKKIKKNKTINKIDYLNINKDYSGFFISNYSDDLFDKLGKNTDSLSNQDKLGIVHDFFALILAGRKQLEDFYRYIDLYFSNERSAVVLHYLIAKLTGIFLLLGDGKSKDIAGNFSKIALEKIVGFEPKDEENVLETFLRGAALSSLTLFDDEKLGKFIKQKFMNYLKNDSSLHPDLRAVVYASAVWFNDSNYQIIKSLCRSSTIQEEKTKFLMALGKTKNKNLIKKTLYYSLGSEVPFAFLPYVVSSTARNPYAKEIALDWLMNSWSELVKRSGGLANMLLRKVLQSIVPICAVGNEKTIENFLKKNRVTGLEKTIEQVLEELRVNSAFVNKYKE